MKQTSTEPQVTLTLTFYQSERSGAYQVVESVAVESRRRKVRPQLNHRWKSSANEDETFEMQNTTAQ